ncbi:MAG: hypothetical protein K2K56_13270 [Lachnospiraceae bacterium]|nr:hypothetical protein [Lachnospiraceae bacterium]
MNDLLGRFWAIIFGCIIIFYTPMLIITLKQDTMAQSIIDNAAVEFVDNSVAAGNFSIESYYEFLDNVNKAGTPCDITIVHTSSVMYAQEKILGYAADGTPLISYDVAKTQIDHGTEEVLTALIRNDFYDMKQGDYFKVTIKNAHPTLGSQLLGLISKGGSQRTLFTSYGSAVGNKKQL